MAKRLEQELEKGTMRGEAIWEEYRGVTERAKAVREAQLEKATAELREKDKKPKEITINGEEEGEIIVKGEALDEV